MLEYHFAAPSELKDLSIKHQQMLSHEGKQSDIVCLLIEKKNSTTYVTVLPGSEKVNPNLIKDPFTPCFSMGNVEGQRSWGSPPQARHQQNPNWKTLQEKQRSLFNKEIIRKKRDEWQTYIRVERHVNQPLCIELIWIQIQTKYFLKLWHVD